jgi:hypothetical protein
LQTQHDGFIFDLIIDSKVFQTDQLLKNGSSRRN